MEQPAQNTDLLTSWRFWNMQNLSPPYIELKKQSEGLRENWTYFRKKCTTTFSLSLWGFKISWQRQGKKKPPTIKRGVLPLFKAQDYGFSSMLVAPVPWPLSKISVRRNYLRWEFYPSLLFLSLSVKLFTFFPFYADETRFGKEKVKLNWQ